MESEGGSGGAGQPYWTEPETGSGDVLGKGAGSAGGHCAAPWPARAVSGALSLLPIRRENVTLEQVERRGCWPAKPGSIDPGEGKVSVGAPEGSSGASG